MRRNFRGLAQIVLWLLGPGEKSSSQALRFSDSLACFFSNSKWVRAPGEEALLPISLLHYSKLQYPLKSERLSSLVTNCIIIIIRSPSQEHAAAHIAVLVEADRRGHYSHGFNRFSKKLTCLRQFLLGAR